MTDNQILGVSLCNLEPERPLQEQSTGDDDVREWSIVTTLT